MQFVAERLGLDDMHFLYLQDEKQEVARRFGAKVNPEVFSTQVRSSTQISVSILLFQVQKANQQVDAQ
jgi:hypothetical protein